MEPFSAYSIYGWLRLPNSVKNVSEVSFIDAISLSRVQIIPTRCFMKRDVLEIWKKVCLLMMIQYDIEMKLTREYINTGLRNG